MPRLRWCARSKCADGDRGQVGRHRLAGRPGPRRDRAVAVASLQRPVGDHLEGPRCGDPERVGGLVGRVVVDREPGRGGVRLSRDHGPVVGVEEAARAEALGLEQARPAAVPDHRAEALPPPQSGALRVDRQLAGVPPPGRPVAVDADRLHLQTVQVQVEPGQVLRAPSGDRRDAGQPPGGGPVAQVQPVALHVVAAVAVPREVRVPDAGRAGPEPGLRHLLRPGPDGLRGARGERDGQRERDQQHDSGPPRQVSHSLPPRETRRPSGPR